MNNFLKTILNFEVLNAFLGWLMFSMLTLAGLSLISEIIDFIFFNELSMEIRVITGLLLGYWFWFPYWDNRNRG